MDFLLECIGFPPDTDQERLAGMARRHGERVAWRGPTGEHYRLDLGGGLELRLDREGEGEPWTLLPFFSAPHRLRVAVTALSRPSDSPFDALLDGWADPLLPSPTDEHFNAVQPPGAHRIAVNVCDGRRLPARLPRGHVLAVSVAGFALDVNAVVANASARDARFLDHPRGAWIEPLSGSSDPGGCVEASLRVREVRRMQNPLTGNPVQLLETDAPGRPLPVFVSPWQLERDGLEAPRPGWRIEGTFLLTGRISGGLPGAAHRLGRVFG